MAKRKPKIPSKVKVASGVAEPLFDLIEVQYHLAECRTQLETIDDHLSRLTQKEQAIQKQIQALQDELAEVQTRIGEFRSIATDINEAVKSLKEVEPLLLSEIDATETMKTAYRQNKVDVGLELYFTESEAEFLRMQKALNTIGAEYYGYDKGESSYGGESDLYIIEVDMMPESYREFLFGYDQ